MSMLHTILSLVSRYTERGAILIILNVFLGWANACHHLAATSINRNRFSAVADQVNGNVGLHGKIC